jgi:SAM-dependent methyltransferase
VAPVDSQAVPDAELPSPAPADDAEPAPSAAGAGQLYGHWYYGSYAMPYEEENWRQFFGGVADAIVAQLAPKTVLDAGCAKGFLVAALRERGVDASGFDLSEVAVAEAPETVRDHVRVGSLTEPIEGRYDLITCIEVIEHLDPADAAAAVANLASATDRVLLSSTPGDRDEPTHVNIQPPERWSQLFAAHGMFRDFRHDPAYLSPWATLYRRSEPSLVDVVLDYDRAWYELRAETLDQRRALLDMQAKLEKLTEAAEGVDVRKLTDEVADLRKEMLRLRDAAIGHEAELATARGRATELEAQVERYGAMEDRLNEVLGSTSWRITQAAATPLRKLRERRDPGR